MAGQGRSVADPARVVSHEDPPPMTQPPPGYQRFFAELKRRKVFRVALVYGATGFVVVQAADLVFRGLEVPSWALTITVTLALLGFPVVLVLAWALEATPEGVRRTEAASREEIERIVTQPAAKRWPTGLAALAGVGLLVAGAWYVGYRSGPSGADEAGISNSVVPEAEQVEASIAVFPFADMSPAGDQEHFSDGIAEELLNLLARVPNSGWRPGPRRLPSGVKISRSRSSPTAWASPTCWRVRRGRRAGRCGSPPS